MADGGYVDGVSGMKVKEEAVVAAAETESGMRRLKPFHVAVEMEQVTVEKVKNHNGSLTVDGADGYRTEFLVPRPRRGAGVGVALDSLLQAELAEDVLVGNAIAAFNGSAGAIESLGSFGCDRFIVDFGLAQGTSEGFDHDLKEIPNRIDLLIGELVQQGVSLLGFLRAIDLHRVCANRYSFA